MGVMKCQAMARGWLGGRLADERRASVRILGEERAVGAVQWTQLFRKREQEELIKGGRLESLEENLELHQVGIREKLEWFVDGLGQLEKI